MTKWIEVESTSPWEERIMVARRDIDGAGPHLFRVVKNGNYTARWNLFIVDKENLYEARFKSLKAARELAESYHPSGLVRSRYWNSEYPRHDEITTADGKNYRIWHHTYQGWDSRQRPGWVGELLTPWENACRTYRLAVENRDAIREGLDAAERAVLEAAATLSLMDAINFTTEVNS